MKKHHSWNLAWMTLLAVGMGCAPADQAGEEASTAASTETAAVASSVPVSSIRLSPLSGSPDYPGVTLTLNDFDPANGTFDFAVAGYELGTQTADAGSNGLANSGKGQHIHLIVDNGPYSAHYTDQAEIDLAPGRHTVLAFLSRSYHESVKEPTAAVLTEVVVSEGSDGEAFDTGAPHLFYSRPKGTYVGSDTEKLMLDFYLANVSLSADGYRVRALINGQEFLIDQWQPYLIEGLPMGEVTVELSLLDSTGNVVPGLYNEVTRMVTLQAAAE